MNYFVCTYGGWEDRGNDLDFILLSKNQNRYWFHEACTFPSSVWNIVPGDIIFLKNRATIVAWGKAAEKYNCNDSTLPLPTLTGWNHSVHVERWHFCYENEPLWGIHHYGIGWHTLSGGQYSVIKQVDENYGNEKIAQFPQNILTPKNALDDIGEVDCVEMPLEDLLKQNLFLPDYQRAYSWKQENINGLLNSIGNSLQDVQSDHQFYLGTVILKKDSQRGYSVIDGQQRLTTLSLLAYKTERENSEYINLLRNSRRNVSEEERNIFLFAMKCVCESSLTFDKLMGQKVLVNVVVLPEGESEDLAYTFFSTTNSTGVKLTDFDLLKSHHLRYVTSEENQEIVAGHWADREQELSDFPGLKRYTGQKLSFNEALLFRILYRLRRWSKKDRIHRFALEPSVRDVFSEFKVVSDPLFQNYTLPEKTVFNSIMSGGMEFFRYIEEFSRKFQAFGKLEPVKILGELAGVTGGGKTFCEAAMAISFLYYCRFGEAFVSEAIYAIIYRVSSIRNLSGNPSDLSYFSENYKWVYEKCVAALEHVTEPGMFLAWALNPEERYVPDWEKRGAKPYWGKLTEIIQKLLSESQLDKQYRYLVAEEMR